MSPDKVCLFAVVTGLVVGCDEGGPLDTGPAPSPEPVYGSVQGRVTVDGLPLTGVSIALTREGTRIASRVTATSGEYEFLGLEPGLYSVVILQNLGVSCITQRSATVQGGKRTQVNFPCASPVTYTGPRGNVMGRVTRNGIGLPGVKVYLCHGRSWWAGCFPIQITNFQGLYAYDIGRGGPYFLFADCGPGPWSGALVGPMSAEVRWVAGRSQTFNFECP